MYHIRLLLLTLLLWGMIPCSLGQFPMAFYETGRNREFGKIFNIDSRTEGMIYGTFYEGGIRAIEFAGDSLTTKAFRITENYCTDIASGPDGTIFVDEGSGGLCAYRYTGSAFQWIASSKELRYVDYLTVKDDGIIYVSKDGEGLYLYSFDGANFEQLAHTDPFYDVFDIAFGKEGVFFVANSNGGVKAYQYRNDTLRLRSSIELTNKSYYAYSIATLGDEVYVAFGKAGVLAARFDYSSFAFIESSIALRKDCDIGDYATRVMVAEDGMIYASYGSCGVYAYYYDGIFMGKLGRIEELPHVGHAFLDREGNQYRVVAVDDGNELSVYAITDEGFTRTANLVLKGGIAHEVEAIESGEIFLANGWGGLVAYEFRDRNFIPLASINDEGEERSIYYGEDGILYLGHAEPYGLRAYHFDGSSFEVIASSEMDVPFNGMEMSLDQNSQGIVFLGVERSGLYAFSLEDTLLIENASIETENCQDVALGNDSTLFVADDNNDLVAYKYDGNTFSPAGHIEEEGRAVKVEVGADNTIFVGYDYSDLLCAYTYQNDTFTKITELKLDTYPRDITVGYDSTLFIATYDGAIAFTFRDSIFTRIALSGDYSGDYVSMGKDSVLFYSSGRSGLRAFRYTRPDLVPPIVPENLSASNVFSTSFRLNWDPSTDNLGIAEYRIYIDDQLYTNTLSHSAQMVFLQPQTTYQTQVSAVDLAGNESQKSAPLAVSTLVSSSKEEKTLKVQGTDGLLIYPNPAIHQITLEAGNEIPGVLEITDLKGSIIMRQSVITSQISLDLSGISTGIYILSYRYGHDVETFRLIKLDNER